MRFPHLLAIPVLLLASAIWTRAAHPSWQPVSKADLDDDVPKIEVEAPAEYLNFRVEVDDSAERTRDVTILARIKVYDPGRAVDITRVSIFLPGASGQYVDIRARLTLPDGTTRDFDRHDLRERKVREDGRTDSFFGRLTAKTENSVDERFLAVTGVAKGAVLDVWEYWPGLAKTDWYVTNVQRADAPVRSFEYLSRYITGDVKLHKTFVLNPHGGQVQRDEKGGIFRFTAIDLPSIHREPFAPPDAFISLAIIEAYENMNFFVDPRSHKVRLPDAVPGSLGPWAFYSTAMDFQDADKGYADGRVRAKAAELTAGITDPREKARRIYNYVQGLYQRFRLRADMEENYTRVISSVGELTEVEWTDSTFLRAEDFQYLFIGLARSCSLECHSAFHALRNSMPFMVDLVSPHFLQAWSVAVKVNDKWVLCLPCAEWPLPFGELPWGMEGQPALMAMARQQMFLKVPAAAAESSRSEAVVDVTLNDQGDLEGTCVRTFTGHSAAAIRERLAQTGEELWGRSMRDLLGVQNSPCEAHLVKVEGLENVELPVTIEARIFWPAYAPVLGDRIPFLLSVWTNGRPPILSHSARTTPTFFNFPSLEHETITVRLPKGFAPAALPKPMEAGTPEYHYRLTVATDAAAGTLTVDRTSLINTIDIPVSNYPTALDWFRRISVADQTAVILQRAPELAR